MSEFLKELWQYARERKKFWLIPLVILMLLMGLLIVSVQTTATSPFLYSLF